MNQGHGRKSFTKTVIAFLTVIALLICITPIIQSASAAEKVYKLKYSGAHAKGTPLEIIPEWWGKELEKRTGGKVKVEFYFGQALGKQFDFPKMLKAGVCDYALLPSAAAEFPMLAVGMAPFLMPNMSISAEAFWGLYYKGLLKELDDFKPLFYEATDPFIYFFRDKQVTKMEDLKGLKLRGLPGLAAELNNELGATGIAMAFNDVYTALERGTLDGLSTTIEAAGTIHLEEILDTCLFEPLFTSGNIIAMTKKLWDSYPKDIQIVMEQLNTEAKYKYIETIHTPSELKAVLEKKGYTVTTLSAEEKARWDKIGQKILDKWIEENEADGYPAGEIVDVIQRFNKYFE